MYASLQIQIPKCSHGSQGCNICAQTHRRADKHSHTELMPKATQLHLLQIRSSSTLSLHSDQCLLTVFINLTLPGSLQEWRIWEYCSGMCMKALSELPVAGGVCLNLTIKNGMRDPLSTITSSEKAITDKSAKSWMGYESWNQWSGEQRAQLLQWKLLGNF